MNMRYGSCVNPKWMLDALWRKRKVIFFVISAASFAGNAVVLAESFGIHKTLASSLRELLLRLHEAGEVLAQRPVLYMLLNLIMLRMVVKSGVLGGRVSQPLHEADIDRRADTSMPIHENFDDHPSASAHEQAFFTSVSMRRRTSAVFFSYAEPALDSNVSFEQGVAGKPTTTAARQPKQASLFTIEPLDSSIEAPSNTSMSAPQIMGTAQLEMSIDTTSSNFYASQEPPIEFRPVSHDDNHNEVSYGLHKDSALNHPKNRDCPDDNDLDRQEFNERVETFITKFKRNLTMQRQDSFNRLLGLVGVGVKRS